MQHSEQCRANANLWLEPVPEPEPEPVPEPVPEPEPVSLLQLPPPAPPSCSAADHLRDRCSNTKVATQRLQQLLQHSSCRHALTKGMASWTRAWMGRACPPCLHLASPASLLELLLLLEPLLVPYWLDCLCLQIQQSLWLK